MKNNPLIISAALALGLILGGDITARTLRPVIHQLQADNLRLSNDLRTTLHQRDIALSDISRRMDDITAQYNHCGEIMESLGIIVDYEG